MKDLRAPVSAIDRALLPGTLVQRFEIVRVIAESPVGIDYLARDRERGTEVLLKEYLPQRLAQRERARMAPQTPDDAEVLARGLQAFVTEGHLLARIEHPSLVRVLSVIEANATAYQVQPNRGGVSLLQVRQEMTVPPGERIVRTLIDGLLGALDALHQDGILHGAVAPGNIVLLASDQPLLLGPDLARAEITNGLIESLMASVEPAFGAPEQRNPSPARPVGAWTDLYGLAATIRFFIGGELPPPAAGMLPDDAREPTAEMMQRVCTDTTVPRYSAALLKTLDAALATRSDARPRSVAAFRVAIGTLPRASQRPVQSRPQPLPPPPPPLDSVPGTMSSRFIEPDPEPDPDIDRILPHGVPPATDRYLPAAQRASVRWAAAAFALAFATGLGGWWWANRAAPLDLPPTSAGPATAPPVSATEALPEPAPMAAVPAPAPARVAPPVSTRAPPPAPLRLPPPTAPAVAAPSTSMKASPASPRDACAGRTQFSLYRCMQTQCEQRAWTDHPLCVRLRATDSVE